jgi:hypothetical protein
MPSYVYIYIYIYVQYEIQEQIRTALVSLLYPPERRKTRELARTEFGLAWLVTGSKSVGGGWCEGSTPGQCWLADKLLPAAEEEDYDVLYSIDGDQGIRQTTRLPYFALLSPFQPG